MNTIKPITDAPLIYDISFYQEEFKFGKLPLGKQQPVGFYLNAGIGLVKDVQFARNWQKCKDLGYFRQSYWAYHPDYSHLTQIDKWYEQNPLIDYLPRIMDLERVKGVEPHIIAACVMDMSDIILSRDGHRPWIYSRNTFLEPYILPYWPEEFIDEHYLILAEYNNYRDKEEEGIDIPELVEPEMVLMKQTADQMEPDPLGLCPGFLDRNRWLHGNEYAMDDFFYGVYGHKDEPPPPPPVDCCEELLEDFNEIASRSVSNSSEIADLSGEIADNTAHIADNASFIQTNADEIEKLKENVERHDGIHTRHAKLLCEILDDVNEFELQNNHIHPAWLRKLGLVK